MQVQRFTVVITIATVIIFLGISAWGAASLPVVKNTFINYGVNPSQITINGSAFSTTGIAPTILFNNVGLAQFGPVSFSNTQTVASSPPSTQPGSYRLRITNSQGNVYEFDVTYGAVGPQGPTGTQGPIGPAGATGAAGAAGLNWRGTWNMTTAYNVRGAVSYLGSSYVATAASTGFNPNQFSTTTWNPLATGYYWRGPWSSTTAYYLNDTVSFNGSSYVSLVGV